MQAQRLIPEQRLEGISQLAPSLPPARPQPQAKKPAAEKSEWFAPLSSRDTPSRTLCKSNSPTSSKLLTPSASTTASSATLGLPAIQSPTIQLNSQEFRRTRIFVISDTHNLPFPPPKGHVDLVVCLGDHTERSTKQEFETFIQEVLQIDADHIFVIFGNHEYSTDPLLPRAKYPNFPAARLQSWEEHLTRDHALQLCRTCGIIYLDEGQEVFHLNNGTTVKIYASSYTPKRKKSAYSGYRYKRKDQDSQSGHEFKMDPDVDLVFTHGPPEGILDDYGTSTSLRGCQDLLEAVASSRPRLHCFGHNHAAWGATLVDWENGTGEKSLLEDAIARQDEPTLELTKATKVELVNHKDLASLRNKDADSLDPTGCCRLSHCSDDQLPVAKGSTTLFVNAAYEGVDSNNEGIQETHMPVIVELDLPLTIKSTGSGEVVQAIMKQSPTSHSTLVSRRAFLSGQPGSWTPPHKRQNVTDQKPPTTQAAKASEAPHGGSQKPIEVSLPATDESRSKNVFDGSEENSTSQVQHDRGRPESTTSRHGLFESSRTPIEVGVSLQQRRSAWGVRDTAEHIYRPVNGSHTKKSGDNGQKKSGSPTSTSTTSPRRGSKSHSPSSFTGRQANVSRAKSAGPSPKSEQRIEVQPNAESTNQSGWRNRTTSDHGQTTNGNSSSERRRKTGNRGVYGFSNSNQQSNRNTEGPWK
ncbi:hypothetical protein N0V93_000750 [Gnomoniopsis smithogilvyi]|uniref:Calcineurin-like phosphoesterase domain-containing protein n=1 Tax=Gnomoniopsis smithogilvyi TaxID=1191159 RepID=A0A9W9D205_9PEZI|nr:hypothetical protein N0V93_000750 [Gnomoniopsis smithogilvyi]